MLPAPGISAVNTSVVLVIYHRPDLTARVFERIRDAKPPRLFLVADGPKDDADAVKCRQAREAVAEVDWPCETLRDYCDENIGSRRRVSSGLDWVFSLVDEAIILEDDCLPHPAFFRFCEELLDHYRGDRRIGHIAGSDLRPNPNPLPYSYYFSRYPSVWGWATWRRAWSEFDVDRETLDEVERERRHFAMFATRKEARYFMRSWKDILAQEVDAWDGQWLFCRRLHNTLCINPNGNLVTNIGFRHDATHTKDTQHPFAEVCLQGMEFPLRHPPNIVCNEQVDRERARAEFLRRQGLIRRLIMKLSNKHFYGALVRKIPLAGGLWARHKQRRRGDLS